MAQSIQLQGTIVQTSGISGDIAKAIILGLQAITGTAQTLQFPITLASGANSITLPVTTPQFIFVQNTHASNTIVVSWTPSGGSLATVITLRGGGSDFIICSTQVGSGSGVTTLGLNASGANTTANLIVFG